jgi:hypothetical protein
MRHRRAKQQLLHAHKSSSHSQPASHTFGWIASQNFSLAELRFQHLVKIYSPRDAAENLTN